MKFYFWFMVWKWFLFPCSDYLLFKNKDKFPPEARKTFKFNSVPFSNTNYCHIPIYTYFPSFYFTLSDYPYFIHTNNLSSGRISINIDIMYFVLQVNWNSFMLLFLITLLCSSCTHVEPNIMRSEKRNGYEIYFLIYYFIYRNKISILLLFVIFCIFILLSSKSKVYVQ